MIHDEREIAGRERDAAHEPNTVGVSSIVMFIICLSTSVVLIALLVLALLRYFDVRKARTGPSAPPLTRGEVLPPEPRLQGAPGHASSPAQDIRQFREQENRLLHSYGWVDEQNGVVRIPVDQAKRLIVERGLPTPAPMTALPQSGSPQSGAAP
jgi:hypothetical protein